LVIWAAHMLAPHLSIGTNALLVNFRPVPCALLEQLWPDRRIDRMDANEGREASADAFTRFAA
jgi:hypothetical protein